MSNLGKPNMKKVLICTLLSGFLLSGLSVQAEEKIDFEKEIYPFIKSSCVTCHRPPYETERAGRIRITKPKAGMIFSTKEGLLAAEYETEDGEMKKILVAGDPDGSRMLEVTLLPLDDDMHFPPEGKAPQWTTAEKELFAKWIEQGADFGDWVEDPAPNEGLEWDGVERE